MRHLTDWMPRSSFANTGHGRGNAWDGGANGQNGRLDLVFWHYNEDPYDDDDNETTTIMMTTMTTMDM